MNKFRNSWMAVGLILGVGSLAGSAGAPASAATSTPVCRMSQIEVAVSFPPGGGAAGTTYVDYLIVNTSTSSCLLRGFPSFKFDDAAPGSKGALTVVHSTNVGKAKNVVLAPLSDASFAMSYGDAFDQGIKNPSSYFSTVGWVHLGNVRPTASSWFHVPTDFNLAYAGFRVTVTPIVSGPTPPTP